MTPVTELQREILAQWPRISTAAIARGIDPRASGALPGRAPSVKLLTTSRKVELGESIGVSTAVQYLAPATESGRDVCPFRTDACTAACLGHSSGRMAMDNARNARLWRTALYFGDRDLFFALQSAEIERHVDRSRAGGMIPAVRLDGTSDLGQAKRYAPLGQAYFYDYTKSAKRALEALGSSWHVTYSHHGNMAETVDVLRHGAGVAAVFATPGRKSPLPDTFMGYPVVDGDTHDARFADRQLHGIDGGYVVGLRFKSSVRRARMMAAAVRAGFTIEMGAS